MKRWQTIGWLILLSAAIACTFSSQKRDIQRGEEYLSEGKPSAALDVFERAAHGSNVGLALEAARKAARLAHLDLKRFQKAIDYYRFIIVTSDNDSERKLSQKYIAQIYFDSLLYYDKAIIEYEKLLRLDF